MVLVTFLLLKKTVFLLEALEPHIQDHLVAHWEKVQLYPSLARFRLKHRPEDIIKQA